MGDETLKPCPFCGAAGTRWRGAGRGNACCPSDELPCGAVYYSVAEWNRRPVEDALTARAEAAEQRAEALAAEVAQARAEGAAVERARIVAHLRAQAEEGGDPWMAHVADEIKAGAHRRSGSDEG